MPDKTKTRNDSSNGKVTHPIDTLEWVDAQKLYSNDYNPNHVAPPELALLKISILEDGWTHPAVIRPDGELVDGFHRWTLVLKDDEVRALSDGKVPVVYLDNKTRDEQMASTVRHNRARGVHGVIQMSTLVRSLIDEGGKTIEDVMLFLGMEEEEVERLYAVSEVTERIGDEEFGTGWKPQ